MLALRREERNIREGIREELSTAIQGVSAAVELQATRRASLDKQVVELDRRLVRLTDIRAEYSNLVAQVEQRRTLAEESQRKLAEARAACTAATSSSLLSRVDSPDGGLRPVSPSRTMIAFGGGLASILAGLGVVVLTAPIRRREDAALPPPRQRAERGQWPPRRTNGERIIAKRTAATEVLAERDTG